MTVRVLVNAIGKRIQFGQMFTDAVEAQGGTCVFADASLDAPGLLALGGVESPRTDNPNYLDAWKALFAQHNISHVLSIIDTDQIALSQAAKKCGVTFLGPSEAVIEVCQDKQLFHDRLVQLDIPCVPTFSAPLPNGDFISKDKTGSCGSNVILHDAGSDVASASNRIFQPMVTGVHIDVDFAWDGHTLLHTQKEITVKNDGESYAMRPFHDAAITDLITRLVTGLDYHGVGNADVWWHDGAWHLMEVNPRYGGNSPATILSGLDLIGAQMTYARTGKLPAGEPTGQLPDVTFVKSFHLQAV